MAARSRTGRVSCATSCRGSGDRAGPAGRRAPVHLRHAALRARAPTARRAGGRATMTRPSVCRTRRHHPRSMRRLPWSAVLEHLGVRWVCATAGSPYDNPHVQRPAPVPAVRRLRSARGPDRRRGAPDRRDGAAEGAASRMCVFVGSAYSYLQEWLPYVAQRVVRDGLADVIGDRPTCPQLSRASRPTCSPGARSQPGCSAGPSATAPRPRRNGLVSGCYPLDPFYLEHPAAATLKRLKAEARG